MCFQAVKSIIEKKMPLRFSGEAFLSEDCYSLFNQLHLLRLIHFI
jgi:hypothetical protein